MKWMKWNWMARQRWIIKFMVSLLNLMMNGKDKKGKQGYEF